MVIYEAEALAPQRSEVPGLLIQLVVKEWDQQNKRNVVRMSEYAGFMGQQKIRFFGGLGI